MPYYETRSGGLTTVSLSCEAWRKRGQRCLNAASVTMLDRDAVMGLLYDLGWGLLRGHQVCGECLSRNIKNIHFPKVAKEKH